LPFCLHPACTDIGMVTVLNRHNYTHRRNLVNNIGAEEGGGEKLIVGIGTSICEGAKLDRGIRVI